MRFALLLSVLLAMRCEASATLGVPPALHDSIFATLLTAGRGLASVAVGSSQARVARAPCVAELVFLGGNRLTERTGNVLFRIRTQGCADSSVKSITVVASQNGGAGVQIESWKEGNARKISLGKADGDSELQELRFSSSGRGSAVVRLELEKCDGKPCAEVGWELDPPKFDTPPIYFP